VLPRYGVDGTPTFIVAGKYRITGASAGSYERLFQIIDFLVAREAGAAG
jgi:thiol:disulfide interchange protein DsbA